MRQVMPHRSNIVADPDNCKNFLQKKRWRTIVLGEHSIGHFDWPAGITHLRKLRISSSAVQK
jgi:hypothetical protein